MKSGKDFSTRNGHVFFLLSFWIVYTVYIIHKAYFTKLYISPDSAGYLREAEALLSGHGFDFNYAAGGVQSWFSAWPVGYPALIAFSSMISGCNTYLASKLLTSALIGIELFIFAKHFREKSWLYALILTNYGIIAINFFTWSETAFMPFLLIYCLSLSEILKDENCSAKYYVLLWLSMSGAFMVRYFGAFTVVVSLLAVMMLIIFAAYDGGLRIRANKSRILKLFVTAFFAGVFMAGYLLMNKVMSGQATGVNRAVFTDNVKELAINLVQSIMLEASNILSVIVPLLRLRARYFVPIALPIIVVSAYVIYVRLGAAFKRKRFDGASVFFITGICYYVMFTVIRFNSSMDGFSYRFWAPASMLILTGLVSCFFERFREWDGFSATEKRIKMCGAVTMAVIAVCIAAYDFRLGTENTAYARARDETMEYFDGVPSGTVILFCGGWEDDNGEYHEGEKFSYPYANFLRRDIVMAGSFRVRYQNNYSMEYFRRKYRGFKYFGMSKYCYENEISQYPSRYSELLNTFRNGETVQNFIIIPAE